MPANIWIVPRAPRVRLRQAAVVAASLAYLSAYSAAILAVLSTFTATREAALWETTCSGLFFAAALTLWLCDVQRSRNRPAATVTTLSGTGRPSI
jgi:hypothetical protein